MSTPSLPELLQLSEAERIQLAQDLWDSISPASDALPLTEEQRQELDRRLTEHKSNPDSGVPWAEVRARLLERFGA